MAFCYGRSSTIAAADDGSTSKIGPAAAAATPHRPSPEAIGLPNSGGVLCPVTLTVALQT
jgi:hypothetical protein